MLLNSATLEHNNPISLLVEPGALKIRLFSYAGSVDVGLTACRRTVSHRQNLIHLMEDALIELDALIEK